MPNQWILVQYCFNIIIFQYCSKPIELIQSLLNCIVSMPFWLKELTVEKLRHFPYCFNTLYCTTEIYCLCGPIDLIKMNIEAFSSKFPNGTTTAR